MAVILFSVLGNSCITFSTTETCGSCLWVRVNTGGVCAEDRDEQRWQGRMGVTRTDISGCGLSVSLLGREWGWAFRAGDYFGTYSSAVTGGPFWGQERLSSHSMDTCLQGRLRVSSLKQGKNLKESLLLLLNSNKNIPDLVLFFRVNHWSLGFTDPEKAGEMSTFKIPLPPAKVEVPLSRSMGPSRSSGIC